MTADVPAGERQALYSTRSCLFVTTRILVVDQLSGRISGSQIAGIVVLNAHRWVQTGSGCRRAVFCTHLGVQRWHCGGGWGVRSSAGTGRPARLPWLALSQVVPHPALAPHAPPPSAG